MRLSLRKRLTLAFAVLIGLFAVNVVFYFVNDGRRSASFDQLDNALKSRLLVQEIDSSLEERRRRIRLLQVLEGSGDQLVADDELSEILGSLDRLGARARVLQSQTAEPGLGHSELVTVMEPLLDLWADYFRGLNSGEDAEDVAQADESITDSESHDAQADGETATEDGDPSADELYQRARGLLDRLDKIEADGVQKASQEYWEVRRLTNQATIGSP